MNAFAQLDSLTLQTHHRGTPPAHAARQRPGRREETVARADASVAGDFVQHLHRTRETLVSERLPLTPARIYARLLPGWQDWWDANDLPDTYLTSNLWILRRRLLAMEREAAANPQTKQTSCTQSAK